jgi:hypothetical protein
MRVFENMMLRGIFGLKKNDVTESRENCIMKSFIMCTRRQV